MADTNTISTRRMMRHFLNLTVINITNYFAQQQQQEVLLPSTSSCHVVLAFIVPVLINLIQVKYQGNQTSPFETHPKSTCVAVVSLLLYCLAYDAETRVIASPVRRRRTTRASIPARAMVVFGSLSMASLAFILFPRPLGPVLYFTCVVYAVGDLLLRLWNWLRSKIFNGRQAILPV